MSTETRTALHVLRIILHGWANSDERGHVTFHNLSPKASGWVVFEQSTGNIWHVVPSTRRNAEREARLSGIGHVAMPFALARYSGNIWNHGRAAGRKKMTNA